MSIKVHMVIVGSCHLASCAPLTQPAPTFHPGPHRFRLPTPGQRCANLTLLLTSQSGPAEMCNFHTVCSPLSRLGPCRFLQEAPGQLRTPSFPSMIIKQALEAGAGVDVKILNYHKNGSAMWNQLAIVPLRSADGSVTHHVGMQVGQQVLVAVSLQSHVEPGCPPYPWAVTAQPQ